MADVPGIPAGLPLIEITCSAADLAFGSGAAFWDGLEERVAGCGLEDVLDRALAGRPAPRVWALVHEPGQPALAAAAALGFARALADRGQAALVLDGDDQAGALTGWSGRENTEGWIDVVRYGTSLLTSGVPLPFAGRTAYLLGVGSYAPTDVSADELDQLLARLRRQADDLLVVLPGGAGAAAWAQRADIRLLCHDQAELTLPRLAGIVANLTAAGVAPTALLGFGVRPSANGTTPAVPAEDAPPSVASGPEPAVPDPVADEAAAGRSDEPDFGSAPEPDREDDSVKAALAALEEQDIPMGPDRDLGLDPEIVYARRRGTSGVFWLVAVAAIVLIALVGVYYMRYVRVPDGGLFGDGAVVVARDDAGGEGTAAAPQQPADAAALPTADAATVRQAGDSTAVAGETGGNRPEPTAEPAPAEATPVFDADPYRGPVGAGGWALQVYSLRDSTSAAKEMQRIERLGLRAAARIVELPDSGRWWRIYVGSFASRAEARAAEPALFERLRTDWAKPSQFTVAVTDTAGR